MTRKLLLYAGMAAVMCAAPAGAAPPCGACIHAAVRLADWGPGRDSGALALVLTLADMSAGEDSWLEAVRSARAIVLELEGESATDPLPFVSRRALAALRGANSAATLAVLGDAGVVGPLLAGGVAAYLDAVVVPAVTASQAHAWKKAHAGLRVWSTLPFTSFSELVPATAAIPDAAGHALVWPPVAPSPALVEGLKLFADAVPGGLVASREPPPACEPRTACRSQVLERPDTRGRLVVVARLAGGGGVFVQAPSAEVYAIVPAVEAIGPPDRFIVLAPVPADASGRIQLSLAAPGASHLFAILPPPADVVAEVVDVVGARQLSVEEIVARHQAQAAQQDALVEALITHGQTTVTFEVPSFAAPVTVQARTTIHERSGTVDVVQRDIRVNGVAFSESSFPRLPVIEPERVAAPPLAITLSRAYRYRLVGRDRAGGRETYVVAFDPIDDGASLFRGRAWIDAATFGVVRLDAVQTNLRGPITSSQQIEEFTPQEIGGDTLWLLARSEVRQVYHGAGITTPIHRLMAVERREVNPADAAARLDEAARGGALRLRDTGEGLRYVDRGRATRIVTLAGGVIIDPNISDPLPFAGVNYSDFDFAGVGAQVNAFFGGAYGQFAFSVPSLGGSRWQLAGAGFAMLARYNDRAFRAGRERYEENLSQRPAHTQVGLIRPIDPRTSARLEYVFDYVALDRNDSTVAAFVVPADQAIHGAKLSVERQQWGWRLAGWWNPARRAGWRPWGLPGTAEYDSGDATYQRYGVSASRPWVLGPRVLTRVDLGLMGGRDLDRFSRFAFDSFENRLHGYPSASVRYDRGAVLRTAVAVQPGGRLRLDGFADAAWVREPGFGRAARTYPGVGAAVEAPGPFGLLLAAEWAYGFNGLNANGRRGTQVVRFTGYKLF